MRRACIFLLLVTACGDDDFVIDVRTDAAVSDAFVASDAAAGDSGGADVGAGDSGGSDAGPATDAGPTEPDAGAGLAIIELSFAGCLPDLSGDVIVTSNDESIAITSTAGSFGSIQLALQDERGNVSLSSQHRVDTGAVINIIAGTTWTNMAMNFSGVVNGDIPDPIVGSLDVAVYDESAGMIDVTFNGATFQNPSDGSICQINGRLRTRGLSF